DDAAAPDLLDAQGRRDAGGQRGLEPAAARDYSNDYHSSAPPAGARRAGRDVVRPVARERRPRDSSESRPPKRAVVPVVLAAALLLAPAAGCERRSEAPYAGPGEKKLNVYIWSEYLPKDVIDEFTRRTGIAVHYDLYDSNEAVLAKLESGVADYDLVVPSDYMVRILIHLKLLRPLDKTRLRNLANLDPRFLNKAFDPGNDYSLPYVWGTTGYGYDRTKTGGVAEDSWAPLFDPRNRGQILMLDDMRECFAVALKYQGHSLNSPDPAVLKQAADLLKRQKPLVKTYNSGDY